MDKTPPSSPFPASLEPYRERLGVDTDAAIARNLNLPFSAALAMVSDVRISLGIPRAPHEPSEAVPDWLRPVLDRIGIDTDLNLAREIGTSPQTLRLHRIRLGHGAPHPKRSEIARLLSRLGTCSDEVIAAQLGMDRSHVRYHRTMLGVAGYVRPKNKGGSPSEGGVVRLSSTLPDWLSPYADQIGVLSDAEISRKTGRSRETIRTYRIQIGRAAARSAPPDLSSVLDRLGKVPDAVLAAEIGVNRLQIQRARVARGIPCMSPGPKCAAETVLKPLLPLLGVQPDREIARQGQVSVGTVIRLRLKLGIPPCPTRLPFGEGVRRLGPYLDKLGVWSDMEIARKADVHISSVFRVRTARGISACPDRPTGPLRLREEA